MTTAQETRETYRPIDLRNVSKIPQWSQLDAEVREAIEVVGQVLPFRTNQYVLENLINWTRVPDDPIFQLVFPCRQMLSPDDFDVIRDLKSRDDRGAELKASVNRIRRELNPHPAGQMTHNVPMLDGRPLQGLQHKYLETVLIFP